MNKLILFLMLIVSFHVFGEVITTEQINKRCKAVGNISIESYILKKNKKSLTSMEGLVNEWDIWASNYGYEKATSKKDAYSQARTHCLDSIKTKLNSICESAAVASQAAYEIKQQGGIKPDKKDLQGLLEYEYWAIDYGYDKASSEDDAYKTGLSYCKSQQEELLPKESNSVSIKSKLNIKQEIITRCKLQMSEYGAAMVKGCVDLDIEAFLALNKYSKKYESTISRCNSTMQDYGYAMVKGCVDLDIKAENDLSAY